MEVTQEEVNNIYLRGFEDSLENKKPAIYISKYLQNIYNAGYNAGLLSKEGGMASMKTIKE